MVEVLLLPVMFLLIHKDAKIRSINFNESDLLTCLSNDYGYDKWMSKALEFYSLSGDLVIIISSSGGLKMLSQLQIGARK